MQENAKVHCPECDDLVERAEPLDRRGFMRAVGGTAAAIATVGGLTATVPAVLAQPPATPAASTGPRPAEELIRELYTSLSADQRANVVKPWNHGAENGQGTPTRQRMYNAALGRRIGQVYTRPQQELCQRILRAIASDENGYRQLTRNGTFDGSRSFEACGADIFGDPNNGQFAWVFSGHHITVRCDGNSEPGAAFGGPMYYGHSPDGYSARNCETVMRTILSPYRREDADEVMEVVRRNGGLERIHLAFYREDGAPANERWHFWRLEGPGFVWNYRVLPHVHTYVNISSQPLV